jgi:hypothetical protein
MTIYGGIIQVQVRFELGYPHIHRLCGYYDSIQSYL